MEPTKTIADYELIKKIGKGAFVVVYKAKRKPDGKIIALKIIDISPEQEKLIQESREEVEYLKKLSFPECHPFIVCYYDSYWDPVKRQFLIEMEYIDGKEMFDFILKPRSNELLYYYLLLIAKDMAKALEYVHSKGIIHNDIKLENIIIENKTFIPKLIDFGLACNTKVTKPWGQSCVNYKGSPHYLAPELFEIDRKLPASDLWALGIALYTAATHKYPYEGDSHEEIFDNIVNTPSPKLATSNKLLNNVVNKLLVKDPTKRLTAKQLEVMLEKIPKPSEKVETKKKITEVPSIESLRTMSSFILL